MQGLMSQFLEYYYNEFGVELRDAPPEVHESLIYTAAMCAAAAIEGEDEDEWEDEDEDGDTDEYEYQYGYDSDEEISDARLRQYFRAMGM